MAADLLVALLPSLRLLQAGFLLPFQQDGFPLCPLAVALHLQMPAESYLDAAWLDELEETRISACL